MDESTRKIILVVLTGFSFGSAVVTSRYALREVSPYVLAIFRFGIAALLYALTLPLLKKRLLTGRRNYIDLFIVGATAFGLPLLLFFFALRYISSGMFSVLFATVPIFTAVLAHLFLRNEKIHKRLLTGLVIGLIGVSYLFAAKTSGLAVFNIKGPLLVMAGVTIAAFGTVYARARLSKYDPLVIASMQTIAAVLVLSAIIFSLGKFSLHHVSGLAWLAIIYNAVAGAYVGFWLTFILVKNFGATAGVLPSYVMPVVSGVLGAILLSEKLTFSLVIGATLIFLGILFSTKEH